ncbi:MAG TPA: RuBisCO large subunit C-terminal-like domain-containing protein [Methanoregulaceae archaeon]|nr:RuBisCO large subunit C-terminal-like domain-containing protein [Methanoregulaceae archaeon]
MADLIATYSFRPRADTTPESAAQALAEEETTGTWTEISTTTGYVRRLDGVVESVEPHGNGYLTRIRYPAEIFEPGNIPQYLSVFAGNLFGLGRLDAVRLLDIDVPGPLVAPFPGPRFGMEGVRRLVGTTDRPHVGTIIKPKVGLTPKDTAAVAYQAAIGGVDLIKDDETLTDQAFCPLADRVAEVMDRLDEARSETGHPVLYAVNITTRADRIRERARTAIEHGANMLMIDVLTAGFDAIRAIAEDPSFRVPIHVHRTMHAAMTRNPEHGIAMRPFARLVRMVGGDQLHTGTASGKMGGGPVEEIVGDNRALTSPFYGLRPIFPVSSGGLHPGKVASEIAALGTDIVLQAGGGIHGHPDGTAAGARAMRQAVDAAMQGVPAEEYAKDHVELARALERWGASPGRS